MCASPSFLTQRTRLRRARRCFSIAFLSFPFLSFPSCPQIKALQLIAMVMKQRQQAPLRTPMPNVGDAMLHLMRVRRQSLRSGLCRGRGAARTHLAQTLRPLSSQALNPNVSPACRCAPTRPRPARSCWSASAPPCRCGALTQALRAWAARPRRGRRPLPRADRIATHFAACFARERLHLLRDSFPAHLGASGVWQQQHEGTAERTMRVSAPWPHRRARRRFATR